MRTLPLILIAGALTAGCGDKRRDHRTLDRDEVLLQVSATGRSESTPDEANFSVGVSSIAATGPAASDANAAKMKGVVDGLKSLGVAEKDIQTSQLTIQRIEYGANKGRFEANNVVRVRLSDTAKVGQAVGLATGAGANVLSGPDFRVSDPEAASRNAYAGAYKAARARADAYAAAADLKVARVLAIRDGGQTGAPPPYLYDGAMRNAAPQAVSAPPVMPGTNTDNVVVSVDFALGPK